MKYYVASKTSHAAMWRTLRAEGIPIVATWIDEAGAGQTASRQELAERCLREIADADVLVLLCWPEEHLKGALVEAGAALALGKRVRCIGENASLSPVFAAHPLWTPCRSAAEAFSDAPTPTTGDADAAKAP